MSGGGWLLTALLGVEIGCIALLSQGWLALPLLLHLGASAAANVIAWRGCNGNRATLRMSAMLLPFLGPIAPVAGLALRLGHAARRSPPPDAAAWHEHLFPNLAADPVHDRMEAIARRQPPSATDDDVESFYDVLRWGTLREREHVLSLISRSFRAEFAPVLREALASDDPGLRAQAAAGLSLLESRTSARLTALEASWQTACTEEAATALAHALADAAHSGLYDESRAAEMRCQLVALLTPRASDPALAAMLGRTLIHLGEFEAAVATLERSVEGPEQTDAAFGWLVEALYRQGDFARLAALIGGHRTQAAALVARDGPLAPALAFWGATT